MISLIRHYWYKYKYPQLTSWKFLQYSNHVSPENIYTTLLNLSIAKTSTEKPPVSKQPFLIKLGPSGRIIRAQPTPTNARNIKQLHNGRVYATYTSGCNSQTRSVYHAQIDPVTLTEIPGTSIRCIGSDVITDMHDYLLLANGNWLVVGYRLEPLQNHAEHEYVAHNVIQEITPDQRLVWEWSSKDIFHETDLIDYVAMGIIDQPQYDVLDYVHINSLFEDNDGHIIVSGKFASQIFKIARHTGEVLWRMGGVRNEFTFIQDPYNGFSGQHTPHRTSAGTLLIYDNGSLHVPQQTRIIEYNIDEDKKTARLVWSYQEPGRYTPATGSAQRLSNGNTLIGWGKEGVENPLAKITEVDPSGEKILEILPPTQYGSYRTYKWPT